MRIVDLRSRFRQPRTGRICEYIVEDLGYSLLLKRALASIAESRFRDQKLYQRCIKNE